MQQIDLFVNFCSCAIIYNNVIRGGKPLLTRCLRCHDRPDLIYRQTISRHDTFDLNSFRTIHHHDPVTPLMIIA